MENNSVKRLNLSKSVLKIACFTLIMLSTPLIAMQFSDEVNWNWFDFLIMGVLLFGTGLIYELFIKRVKNKQKRMLLALALAITFLLIWAELAVGIFGSPIASH